MALTDARVKGLKAKTGVRYSKADGGGLLARCDTWGCEVMGVPLSGSDGKRGRRWFMGRYPDMTLKVAREKRDELATQVARREICRQRKRSWRGAGCRTTPRSKSLQSGTTQSKW